eukprot:37495_1
MVTHLITVFLFTTLYEFINTDTLCNRVDPVDASESYAIDICVKSRRVMEDHDRIVSWKFVCINDQVIVQNYFNSPSCNGDNGDIDTNYTVESTYHQCNGISACPYFILRQYEYMTNCTNKDQVSYYEWPIVYDQCFISNQTYPEPALFSSKVIMNPMQDTIQTIHYYDLNCSSVNSSHTQKLGCSKVNNSTGAYRYYLEIIDRQLTEQPTQEPTPTLNPSKAPTVTTIDINCYDDYSEIYLGPFETQYWSLDLSTSIYQSQVTFQTCNSDKPVNIDLFYANDDSFSNPLQVSPSSVHSECRSPNSNSNSNSNNTTPLFAMSLSSNKYIIRGSCLNNSKDCNYILQICGCKSLSPTKYPTYPTQSPITFAPSSVTKSPSQKPIINPIGTIHCDSPKSYSYIAANFDNSLVGAGIYYAFKATDYWANVRFQNCESTCDTQLFVYDEDYPSVPIQTIYCNYGDDCGICTNGNKDKENFTMPLVVNHYYVQIKPYETNQDCILSLTISNCVSGTGGPSISPSTSHPTQTTSMPTRTPTVSPIAMCPLMTIQSKAPTNKDMQSTQSIVLNTTLLQQSTYVSDGSSHNNAETKANAWIIAVVIFAVICLIMIGAFGLIKRNKLKNILKSVNDNLKNEEMLNETMTVDNTM